jgi:hypothetical protein
MQVPALNRALHETLILDLSRLLPGPLATRMLADLGEEVIKMESPFSPDPLRNYPPLVDGESVFFNTLNARIEHDKALSRVITDMLTDHTELFKQFAENPSFKKWLADNVFAATYGGTKPNG